MANTTNFNWETPDDTDLVKDGAAAIRTLGNSIDTSFVDLKGGTTGQILSKASNTDLDYTWIANDQGDITEVSAGTGISVASGTGPVPVVTNTVATTFDAKGDLVVGTGADTFAKLTVGINGYTLVADSSVSPTGLKWAAPSGGSTFVGVSAYTTSLQTVSNVTWTAINFNNEFFDTDGFHDNSVNNTRLTIPSGKGGYYFIGATVGWNDSSSGEREHKIYLNGSPYSPIRAYTSVWNAGGGRETAAYLATILSLSAGDYIELYGRQTSGGNLSATTVSNFSIGLLGA